MAAIPTEPIGSIPRPLALIERVAQGDSEDPEIAPLYEDAIRNTIERFEATGSPVVTDGEQRKYHNFATYCVHGRRSSITPRRAVTRPSPRSRRVCVARHLRAAFLERSNDDDE
jgi:hypothetical protein